MESLLILIPIAIVIVAIAVSVFFWAVKSGQFEDLDTEGKRILFDDPHVGSQQKKRDVLDKAANFSPRSDSIQIPENSDK